MQIARTKRQREIFDYIKDFIEKRGYEPSYQQIAKHFHIASKSAIAKHIVALEQQGFLIRSRENGSFSLQIASLVKTKANANNDAVCLIEWLESPLSEEFEDESEDEPLYVPALMLGSSSPERLRAFRVRNDAMLGKNIREGDIVLIEEKLFPRDGQCVAAVIDNKQIVLKNYYRSGANIELRPSNDDYKIIEMPADQVEIKGIYRGLLRPLL
ncbi:MAG: transcriptional repressor LexA [Pyrinomonadaceae bacterium]